MASTVCGLRTAIAESTVGVTNGRSTIVRMSDLNSRGRFSSSAR
jgi:hypothetical protein